MPLKDSQTLLQPVDKTRQQLYYHSTEHTLVPHYAVSNLRALILVRPGLIFAHPACKCCCLVQNAF